MNIIAICGSPRKGNTEFVLRRFLIKAEDLGHTTELVLLRERRVENCCGCLTCDDEGKCHFKDDVSLIIERLVVGDLIVFGSPNYFKNVSGVMKNFFDRLHPLYRKKLLKDKKFVAVSIGASGDENTAQKALGAIESVAEALEMNVIGDLYLVARGAQEVEDSPANVQKIDDFVKNILS